MYYFCGALKSIVAIVFLAAVLWQPFYQSGYIAYWQLNKEKIAKTECINRFRPMMHCEGKCQLYQELKKAADEEAENNKLPLQVLKLKNLDTFIEMNYPWSPRFPITSVFRKPFATYHNLYTFLDDVSVFHPPAVVI
ncbi:hypothetical protein [Flavobacterium sp.]